MKSDSLRPELKEKIVKWLISFYHLDPRHQILTFFNLVAKDGADNLCSDEQDLDEPPQPELTELEKKVNDAFNNTSILTVWRPCSNESMRKMMEGHGVGKGLDIKGKSARTGQLSAYVPFMQIHDNNDKKFVAPLPPDARLRVYFRTKQARDYVLNQLNEKADLMSAEAQAERGVASTSHSPAGGTRSSLYSNAKAHLNKHLHKMRDQLQFPSHSPSRFTPKKPDATQADAADKEQRAEKGPDTKEATLEKKSSHDKQVQVENAVVAKEDGANDLESVSNNETAKEETGTSEKKVAPVEKHHIEMEGSQQDNKPARMEVLEIMDAESDVGVAKKTNTAKSDQSNDNSAQQPRERKRDELASNKTSINEPLSSPVSPLKIRESVEAKVPELDDDDDSNEGSSPVDISNPFLSKLMAVAQSAKGGTKDPGPESSQEQESPAAMPDAETRKDLKTSGAIRASLLIGKLKAAAKAATADAMANKNRLSDVLHTYTQKVSTACRPVDDYAPLHYGIECAQRLFWRACVLDQDISRSKELETGRPSTPGFQDANMYSLANGMKNQTDPLPVLLQMAQGDIENAILPQQLVMAYEENNAVTPVVSDFDGFLLGWRREALWFGCDLPREQEDLMLWCVDKIERILDSPPSTTSWTARWLDILKKEKKRGFHPHIPPYGFGDPKSYAIMENAALRLIDTGAVRHGSECFNYYFPQEIDEYFLVISDTLSPVPWKYVNVTELQEILLERISEGFMFPLNPKWILCDPGWKKLYDAIMDSNALYADLSKDVWFPPHSGVRKRIEEIHARHPRGFQRRAASVDDDISGPMRTSLKSSQLLSGQAEAELAELELANYTGQDAASEDGTNDTAPTMGRRKRRRRRWKQRSKSVDGLSSSNGLNGSVPREALQRDLSSGGSRKRKGWFARFRGK